LLAAVPAAALVDASLIRSAVRFAVSSVTIAPVP
jgi:hypothetical protein